MAAAADYPVSTIAKLLDLTERRVQQLAAQGVLPKADRGRYELVPVVRAYIAYLRERAVSGDANGADDVGASRAKLLSARARLATLEADQYERSLLRRADVERAWSEIVANMRARMLAVPSKTAQAIVYLESAAQVASLLTAAVSEALDELSTIPVYVVIDPGSEPDAGAGSEGGAVDGEAAADPDGVGLG